MTSRPLPAIGPSTPASRTASAPAASQPAAAAQSAAAPALARDRRQPGPQPPAVEEPASVDLEGIAVPDELTAADAVMESERLMLRTGSVGAVGKLGAVYAIAAQAKELGAAMSGRPVQIDRAITALTGIAVNLGEFDGWLQSLGVVGGVANAIQGVRWAVESLQAMRAEGANPSNVLGLIASTTQALGGAFQVAAVAAVAACPPAAPVLEAISTGLYLVSGGTYLAQMAYDHRAWIAEQASGAWSAVKGSWSRLTGSAPPEGRAGP